VTWCWNCDCFLAYDGFNERQTIFKREKMFKVTRAADGEVILSLSGRMDAEHLDELKKLFIAETRGRPNSLD
jgi:hypothetical protein